MPFSAEKCQQLAADVARLESALTDIAAGEKATSIQDGPESVSFNMTSQAKIEQRLDQLKRQYQSGGCAVVLGNSDVAPPSARRALKPIIGHR